ncbi:glycerophosphodiester phosphodiesterase [Mariniflexile ostreae]|uniref:Glycerophosphodiester phosphodiesterase n=1 Tax=Mariniflexile ostreae TaxID=1520892 RepID=A0ABV5FDD5_9FLAO
MKLPPLKIGHRGARGHLAENTLESIKKAVELGIEGVEIDVHVCASGELVVFHDFTLDRVTNGSGEISKWTLSELKELKVLDHYSIPTLEEVMTVIDKNLLLNIELKGKNTVRKISDWIDFYVNEKKWNYRDFLVSSFQYDLLTSLRNINPMVMLGVLTETDLEAAVKFAKGISAVSIHPDYTMLTKRAVEKIQAQNFQVFTWTVNDPSAIKRLEHYGVDGIISDFPDRL